MDLELPGGNDHPTWLTATGVAVGYGVVLGVITVALFLVPFGLWTLLG